MHPHGRGPDYLLMSVSFYCAVQFLIVNSWPTTGKGAAYFGDDPPVLSVAPNENRGTPLSSQGGLSLEI